MNYEEIKAAISLDAEVTRQGEHGWPEEYTEGFIDGLRRAKEIIEDQFEI